MKYPEPDCKGPIVVMLEKGDKKPWCTCGESKRQPFCDGAHIGTEFKPLVFAAEEDMKAYLCTCKETKTPPYCDGAHKNL